MKYATPRCNVFSLGLVFVCGGLGVPLVQAQTMVGPVLQHQVSAPMHVSNGMVAAEKQTTTMAIRLAALETLVARLQQRVVNLETKLAPVHVFSDTLDGLAGPHWILEGVNVHIRSGSGQSSDGCNDSHGGQTATACPTMTGLGNLIVGYNEEPVDGVGTGERGGSHNLISGVGQRWQSFGGLLAGRDNTVSGAYASVSGGIGNMASNTAASVSGGTGNTASGVVASVSGGISNIASSYAAGVSGGYSNIATGAYSSVSGGGNNTASGETASVSGGVHNTASDIAASVSGGENNRASSASASVSGGISNTASGLGASISGGVNNRAVSYTASVSGGVSNTANGPYASVSGGESNRASDTAASVSGGSNRTASSPLDWAAGSLFQDE